MVHVYRKRTSSKCWSDPKRIIFWSSNKAADLKTRYGDWQNSELIEFCTEANQYLIKTHKVSLVLFFGLTFSKLVVRLYDLKLKEVIYSTTDQKKLCEVYLDNEERYWVVCSHPAAHGMTREKKANQFNFNFAMPNNIKGFALRAFCKKNVQAPY